MNNKNFFDATEEYKNKIKTLFKEFSSDQINALWADTFEIESVDNKQVTIVYYGNAKIKAFKKSCKKLLKLCVNLALAQPKKIKIVKKREENTSSFKKNKNKNIQSLKFFVIGMVFVCIAVAAVIVLLNYISNREFRETFYLTSDIKVDSGVRVLQLSDLHGVSYGKDNEKLLERVDALNPDIIICTGDMVDSAKADVDFAATLGEELAKIAPTYYIYGNNEVETIYDFALSEKALDKEFGFDSDNRDGDALLAVEDSFEEALEAVGVNVLKNEKDTLQVGATKIDIYGILNSNPSSFWSYSGEAFTDYLYENPDNLKITAVHEPYLFETFLGEYWGDMIVAGHTHGGVVRVPILGPLYTKEAGIFPERSDAFVYGKYDVSGTPLFMSGGLENIGVWRINNQPELVIIDINKF